MRIMKLFVAAAIAVGAMNVATAPATARLTGPVPHDNQRHDAGRHDNDRGRHQGMRGDNDRGRHQGWRGDRGRHHGWSNRRSCRNVWRHGHRQRVCRMVRYRR